jgi:methionine-rich copper-binding protein CopC
MRRLSYATPLLFALLLPVQAQAITLIIQNNYGPALPQQRYVSSSPYAGEKLAQSPEAITITFTRGIRTDKSHIRVYDMFGTQINSGEVLAEGANMLAYMPKLRPGKYRVKWRAHCACENSSLMSDTFTFTVLPKR